MEKKKMKPNAGSFQTDSRRVFRALIPLVLFLLCGVAPVGCSSTPTRPPVAAFNSGGAELNIGGRTILIDPGVPASGMTLFGENGFVLGREAFISDAELTKTLLHETHRLETSESATGASGHLVTSETNAAFSFAERAFREFF